MYLNRIQIIGNVTRDPELRVTGMGQNVCSFGVATNYYYNDKKTEQKVEKTEYHNVVVWGNLAVLANQLLSKGGKVYVEGEVQSREWDAADGTKKNRTEIICKNFINLSPKDRPKSITHVTGTSVTGTNATEAFVLENMDKDEIKLEDIPFKYDT